MVKMKANYFLVNLLFVILLTFAACKKKAEVITKSNVKEVLTRYGNENSENLVKIETKFGNMIIKLYDDTPLHRANFIKLIKEDYYEDGEFYRIVYQFMIQGGDLHKKPDYTIPAEIKDKYFHKKGAIAMARFDENNPNKESSAAEFYIIHGGKYAEWQVDEDAKEMGVTLTPEKRQTYLTLGGDMFLDGDFTVFGEVIEGFEVIDKIAEVKVYQEKPAQKIPFKISLAE
jgi:cyclophilin family peptidyl-prolyl cis-trans isomerase